MIESDFLIIGSGVSGLLAAIKLARHGSVNVVTKKSREDSNTNYAQGGIAVPLDDGDSRELHVQDTLRAGDGLCREFPSAWDGRTTGRPVCLSGAKAATRRAA